ncbi:MAG TPA: superoxide dismutase [Casimicrobiaceae bacterium]|jgi:Fe-Mn family superoxide dismutase|nr:superoxide dismutase [Casimicrobiaceae bacterium]
MATLAALETATPHALLRLPYPEDALAPIISARTVALHHGKHHKAYVDKTNELISGTEFEGQALERIVLATAGKPEHSKLFNNAGQAWNHAFYWRSLKPKGGNAPTGDLAAKIDSAFGGFDALKKKLATTGVDRFGSGWAWLVSDGKTLKVVSTPNAEVPFTKGETPLLTIDVWEHAYYVDYQNRRADYLQAVIDKLLNWDFAAENLARA